jgi:AraC-like DNA-binding protein
MLLSNHYPIKQAAAAVGYADVFYFMRVFKKTTGMTAKSFSGKVYNQPARVGEGGASVNSGSETLSFPRRRESSFKIIFDRQVESFLPAFPEARRRVTSGIFN